LIRIRHVHHGHFSPISIVFTDFSKYSPTRAYYISGDIIARVRVIPALRPCLTYGTRDEHFRRVAAQTLGVYTDSEGGGSSRRGFSTKYPGGFSRLDTVSTVSITGFFFVISNLTTYGLPVCIYI